MAREKLKLETTCANTACGKAAVLTGQAREKAWLRGYGYCSPECGKLARRAKATKPPLVTTCSNPTCLTPGKVAVVTGQARRDAQRRGVAYCSRECSDASKSARAAADAATRWTAPVRVAFAVARWADPAKRAQLAETHRRNGHRPLPGSRSGQGGVPTEYEAKLLAALPSDWILHYRVPTEGKLRTCDIDLAIPAARVAVEVDGHTHRLTVQKTRDARKKAFLVSRGWTVIRISNERVLSDLSGCVAEIMAAVATREVA